MFTEVYPAGEPKIAGADGESLMKALKKQAQEKTSEGKLQSEALYFHSDIKNLPEEMMNILKDGDVVITMGAGSISGVPLRLVELGNA